MSWMKMLEETYENAYKIYDAADELPIPPAHVKQQAHIEIVIDGDGNYISGRVVDKEATLIPATETSAGRTSGGAPHPLCDKIQYVAGDYKKYGGSKSYFDDFKSGNETKKGYLSLLAEWNDFYDHPMLKAVLKYVSKRTLVHDLAMSKVLWIDSGGHLMTEWDGKDIPPIFKVLTKKSGLYDQGSALVRWRVQIPERLGDKVWECSDLVDSWISFYSSRQELRSICYVTGDDKPVAVNHPANIRYAGDKAKLISANDTDGYTFRGRFTSQNEACTVGYDVTQKAHSALRWIISRQGFKKDSQVIVAWAVNNAEIPSLCVSTDDIFAEYDMDALYTSVNMPNLGEAYARELNKKLSGYMGNLGDCDDIVVMALDSATPGRMAITYYQEIKGSDFLRHVEDYHRRYAWRQNFGKDKRFIGAPSIYDIADMAFDGEVKTDLLKSTASRLLPVISEGAAFPYDLLCSICRRAARPQSMSRYEFEKTIGMACGIFAGYHQERGYNMALEENRTERDYLYGRLLALADRIEEKALNIAGEQRDTSAMKLMTRFAEQPAATWRQIELNLAPYRSRLQSRSYKDWVYFNKLMDKIYMSFEPAQFEDNSKLNPAFLLGFHCQRYALRNRQDNGGQQNDTDNN